MKANPAGIEKSNLILWSSDDHLKNSSGHVKSYRCAFCKRGFSNAQALGGHMNIHRRDRAKLRQFEEENPIEPPDASEEKINENITESSEDQKSCTPKIRPCTLSGEDDDIEELQQLPNFFAETPSASGDHIKPSDEEKSIQLRRHSHPSQAVELDLELRLGPEPKNDQTSSAITKGFF